MSLPLELNPLRSYLYQEKQEQETIKAYIIYLLYNNGIEDIETHNHHIYEQSYEKRNKLFINVEGRVSPNTVRSCATPPA